MEYRKTGNVYLLSVSDIDNGLFKFPKQIELKLRLKDMLEKDVDKKYLVSNKMLGGFMKHNDNHTKKGTGFIWKPRDINGVASTLRANGALSPTDNTIDIMQDGYRKPCIEIKEATKKRI